MRNANVTPETDESVKNVNTKDTGIRVLGVVLESLPGNLFHVKLEENDYKVVAYLAGKLMQHKIWVLPGDQVTLELSPYDLTRGRIVWRNPGN
jgi:translation initiation factor IF-1